MTSGTGTNHPRMDKVLHDSRADTGRPGNQSGLETDLEAISEVEWARRSGASPDRRSGAIGILDAKQSVWQS